MRDEKVVDLGNVVRFPVERRTTIELLHGIAPDAREVSLLAETYHVTVPHDLQERADQEAAEYILNQVPDDGRERADMLRGMLDHAVGAAVAAVLGSRRPAEAANAARRELADAEAGLGYWLHDLQRTASEAAIDAAEALVAAHSRTLEAFGVARAVGMAMQGEAWAPRDLHAEADWLLAAEARRRAG